jgi:hypothetical protein
VASDRDLLSTGGPQKSHCRGTGLYGTREASTVPAPTLSEAVATTGLGGGASPIMQAI